MKREQARHQEKTDEGAYEGQSRQVELRRECIRKRRSRLGTEFACWPEIRIRHRIRRTTSRGARLWSDRFNNELSRSSLHDFEGHGPASTGVSHRQRVVADIVDISRDALASLRNQLESFRSE